MKKVLVVFVLIMAVLAVNAQTIEPAETKEVPVRTSMLVADLQKAITDNIETDYVGYTIKEATKVVKKDVVKYEVVIVKDNETETLIYDYEGKFLKKLLPVPEKE